MILAARGERWAALAALLLFIALGLWGARYHWVEQAGTAERDGYVRQAEQLRSGSLPRDPYRPLLYPLAAAALSTLTGDAFAAARLISNLAAAALAWLAFAFGRRLAGAAAGGWAMALVAVNPNLWILGQHTTTDMLFAALGAAALLAGMVYLESPAPAPAVAAGLAFGLAAFTRSNAVFLVPPLLAAWWLARPPAGAAGRGLNAAGLGIDTTGRGLHAAGPGPASGAAAARPRARRASHLAAAAAASLTGLLPHWALRQAVFGNPFHDENWKNLAWKIHGYPDWSYLDRAPYHGLGELLRTDAAAVVRAGWAELVRFAEAGLPQLLGTWAHVLLFLAGAAYVLWRPRGSARSARSAGWLLASGALFVTATAFTFFTWGRLLLLLLPPAGAFSGVLPGSPAPPAPGPSRPIPGKGSANLPVDAGRQARLHRLRRLRRAAWTAVGLAAVLGLAVKTFAYRLPAFIADHPYAEVAALRRLDAVLPGGGAVAGSSPFLGRYLRHRYVDLPDAFGAEIRDPRLYYARLAGLVRREKVSFLVIGAIDLRDRPRALLGPAPPVGWLQPWLQSIPAPTQGTSVAVWRVIPAARGADVEDGVKGADAAGGLQKPAARAAEKSNHSAPPDARPGGA
jgi:hypothetical protein